MTIDSLLDLVDPAEVGMSAARLRHASDLMQHQYDENRSPMMVAVVARHGRLVFSEALGDQRPGGPPLSVDSVFPLSSNGKPMTAATLMSLVERGQVGLNEAVVGHLPELEVNDNEEVMVHHLLTHTAGWDDDVLTARRTERVAAGMDAPPPGMDLLEHILLSTGWDVPRSVPAGTLMQYSNFNYTLLGEIIRRVTGGTLDAAMREYVFEPVGMDSSAVIVPEDLASRVIERPDGIPNAPGHPDTVLAHADPLWIACDDGGCGVHSTAPDSLRFQEMIRNGGTVGSRRVLSRDAVRVMTTNQIPGVPGRLFGNVFAEASWGYGFGVSSHEPFMLFGGGTAAPGVVRHGGAGGISSWIDPHLGINAAYFEMLTESDEFMAPRSWVAHKFEDVITSAVID